MQITSLNNFFGPELQVILRQCVTIDQVRLNEAGLLYSEEKWDLEKFSANRPYKQELSQIGFNSAKEVIGFWIASVRHHSIHHTHRVATRKGSQIPQVARNLGLKTLEIGHFLGCDFAELTVNIHNEKAIKLYLDMGFERLNGDILHQWIWEMDFSQSTILNDRIFVSDSYQLYVMRKKLQ